MKRSLCLYRAAAWQLCLVLIAIIVVGCDRTQPTPEPTPQLKVAPPTAIAKPVTGQTVYVPAYSHIYSTNRNQKIDLAVTLSIRNIDLTHPIVVTSVRYYDSSGGLVRKYLEQPGELGPMASVEYVVNLEDTSGGAGANFIVEWLAPTQVSAPLIEAVMINTMGNQGLSFVSQGRVIKSQSPKTK